MKHLSAITTFLAIMAMVAIAIAISLFNRTNAEAADAKSDNRMLIWVADQFVTPSAISAKHRGEIDALCRESTDAPQGNYAISALISLSEKDSIARRLHLLSGDTMTIANIHGQDVLPSLVFNTKEKGYSLRAPIPGLSWDTPAITNSDPSGHFDTTSNCVGDNGYGAVATENNLFKNAVTQCHFNKARLLCLAAPLN